MTISGLARVVRRSGAPSDLVVAAALAVAVVVAFLERLRLTELPREPLGAAFGPRVGSGADPSVALASSGDVVVLGTLLLLGGLLVPRELRLGPLRPVVALLTGIGLQVTLSLLLLGWPASTVVLLAASWAGSILLRSRGIPTGWRRSDVIPLAIAATLVSITAVATRAAGWVIFTHDSSSYWRGAQQLASSALGPAELQAKRMLALQGLHAPGFGLGTDGVITLGPVLLLAAITLLALPPWLMRTRPPAAVLVAAGLAAALVAVSIWFWWVALYLNSHLLVAVMLLMVVVLTFLTGDEPADVPDTPHGGALDGGALDAATSTSRGLRLATIPIALALATVTLSRTEGFLLAALVLVGTFVHGGRWRACIPVWRLLGVVVIAWNGLLVVGAAGGAGIRDLPLTPVLGIIAGVAFVLTPTVVSRSPQRWVSSIPLGIGTTLWVAAGVLLLTPVGDRLVFAEMVRLNLGEGLGSWYLAAPLIALMGAVGLALTAGHPSLGPGRWLAIGFIPVTMLTKLADGLDRLGVGAGEEAIRTLLSGGGRTSAGDSVTRMWTHIALVAVSLLILGLAVRDRSSTPRPRRPGASTAGAVLMFALVIMWWRPGYLGPDGPVTTVQLAAADTGHRGPELVRGKFLTQTVDVPADVPVPVDVRHLRICTQLALSDLDRGADGDFRIRLRAGDVVAEAWNRGEATDADTVKDLCVEPALPLPSTISVDVWGRSGDEGGAVVVLVDESGRFVRRAVVLMDAPSLDPRGTAVRTSSWTLRRLVELYPILFGGAGVLALAAGRRTPQSSRARRNGVSM